MSTPRLLNCILAYCLGLLPNLSFAQPTQLEPLFQTVDLSIGESQSVRLITGDEIHVQLVALEERRDTLRRAVRQATVTIELNGHTANIVSATYHLPQEVGNVFVDCPITSGYNSNGSPESWALDKDARLRIWSAESPRLRPNTFVYPVKQRWFASLTQMCNEPTFVDGCESPARKQIYYHNGLDIGGCEGLTEVISATDGLIVSTGTEVLAEHREGTPVRPRYDVVYIMDARGWYYRYSHLQEIDRTVKPGRVISIGDRVGLLGKEGGSGGWTHLHFGISARQPSGRWGEQEGYAFLHEAYVKEYQPQVLAVARPHHLVRVDEQVTLDGSRSWSAAGKITRYEWLADDGTMVAGPRVTRSYATAGCYSELLKVTDVTGAVAYDFAVVQVIDPDRPAQLPPMIHPTYWPTQGIRVGEPVTFKVRTFGTTEGEEIWDFGDASPQVHVRSDGNISVHAPDGYAVTQHSYAAAGDYLVRVQRTNRDGITGTGRLHVHVEE